MDASVRPCEMAKFGPDGCDSCTYQHCCAEIEACQAEGAACLDCGLWDNPSAPCGPGQPLSNAVSDALNTCAKKNCFGECFNAPSCFVDGGACPDNEPAGAVTLADCAGAQSMAVVRGTLDGKPFDQTYSPAWASIDQLVRPKVLHLDWNQGAAELYWYGMCFDPDIPVSVTGTMQLPGDSTGRAVKACSLVWWKQDSKPFLGFYRFNLLLDGGDQLTGCVHF